MKFTKFQSVSIIFGQLIYKKQHVQKPIKENNPLCFNR